MYEFIRGTLKDKTPQQTVVECNGIAYRLATPLSTYTRLPSLESTVILYLSLVVREDAHILYAFLLKEERDLFELLLSVSGIGPKTASAIIGHMEVAAFQQAIAMADTRLMSKLPGIGKKTAERLVIEMRDKFKNKEKSIASSSTIPISANINFDAVNALINLGYNALDANRAVQTATKEQKDELDLAHLITAALRHI